MWIAKRHPSSVHDGTLRAHAVKWALPSLLLPVIVYSIDAWDRPLADYVRSIRSDALMEVGEIISVFGVPTLYFLPAGLAFMIFKGGWPDRIKANGALFLLIAAAAPAFLTDLLQLLFARSCPALYLEHGIYEFRFFHNAPEFASFPSEAATVVAAMAWAASVLLPAYRSTFLLLAVLTAGCRLLLGLHYLSDVLAGFLVGITAVEALRYAFSRLGLALSEQPAGVRRR